MSKNISVTENPVSGNVNRICDGTAITGKVKAATDYRIDGAVEGEIECGGKVIIGDKGYVKGTVVSKNMEISGKMEGSVFIENILSLKTNSIINADIITDKLIVELGAQINGNIKMPYNKKSETVK
ncbi:MAG: polymer-forming cytoskeletal protein [Prevotellaceae bacterium]|jgi:cytoskeletal protein CcmA (bactofilin family)|nr:polymer-forming cytoskeletal protein [Prevotellaceae bacterium]